MNHRADHLHALHHPDEVQARSDAGVGTGSNACSGGGAEPILVVGDSMLDRYWEGSVDRISPEAPVPVLLMGREWERAGGAANVALNIASLGGRATLATLLGDDEAGRRLSGLVQDSGIALHAAHCAGQRTTQKIRVVCRRQQLLRVDIEDRPSDDGVQALQMRVRDLLPQHRWVLLSDYAKGCLPDCASLLRQAHARNCRVLVDPKGDDFERYRGAWLIKPNEAEARRAAGAFDGEAQFEVRMGALRQRLEVQHLLVTRGELGMALFSQDRAPVHLRAERREVYDVSGAGDTVLAALAWRLAAGDVLDDAMQVANVAAGVVVGKFGTATVSAAELQRARASLTTNVS